MHPETLFNFQLIVVGGILGILGQGVRVLIGLKKLYNSPEKYHESFDASHMRLTIFIGFVTGGVAALSMQKEITQEVSFSLIAIGYLGVDFLEGLFLAKIAPKITIDSSNTTTTAIVVTPSGEAGATTTALASATTITSKDGTNITTEKNKEDTTTQVVSTSLTNIASVSNALGTPIFINAFRVEYPFPLSDSVGLGAPNQASDVIKLKNRFKSLGFDWTPMDAQVDDKLIKIINLFQSIIRGFERVYPQKTDSFVSVPGPPNGVYQWLQAENAPRWARLDNQSKSDITLGYINTTAKQRDDFGTNWLIDTIKEAGRIYYQRYLIHNPTSSMIHINDLSESEGGDVPDHIGHETGLMVDILLPNINGNSGGITYRSQSYDRAAAREILTAFHNCSLKPEFIYFNDPDLVNEGLCKADSAQHDDHIHFQVKVPIKRLDHFI